MNLIKKASISLLTLAIVACGGGGSPTKKTDTAKTEDTITGAVTVGTPNIGRGSAASFEGNLMNIQTTSLSAGGITNITASVVDITKGNALIASQSYAVVFSSNCQGKTPTKASFTPATVITTTGEITTSYQALGCSGDDAIKATLYNTTGTPAVADTSKALAIATGSVNVASAEVGSVGFVGNQNEQLGFAGVGNGALQATSIVSFNVKDNFGNVLEGKEVTFELSSTSAGASISSVSGVTNAEGVVTTTVNAGTTQGLLSVLASTTTNTGLVIKTASTPISVSTGIAAFGSFAVTASERNPPAYDISGTTVDITVRAADHFNNPIPVGTTIHFTSESGVIPSKCVTTETGGCTVQWTSSGLRPGEFDPVYETTKNDEYLPDTGNTTTMSNQAVKGFNTILAYTLGEGGFNDKNSNGVFDIGEPFKTHPEAFLDSNGDGVRNAGAKSEEFFDLNLDKQYSAAPTKYQGVLCSEAAKADGHCADLMYVNDSVRIVMSQAHSNYVARFFTRAVGTDIFTEVSSIVAGAADVYVIVTDTNGNTPPSGTKVGFTLGAGYTFVGGGEIGNGVLGIFPSFISHPMNRGAWFKVGLTKTTGTAPVTFTAVIEYEPTKNVRVAGSITVNP